MKKNTAIGLVLGFLIVAFLAQIQHPLMNLTACPDASHVRRSCHGPAIAAGVGITFATVVAANIVGMAINFIKRK